MGKMKLKEHNLMSVLEGFQCTLHYNLFLGLKRLFKLILGSQMKILIFF